MTSQSNEPFSSNQIQNKIFFHESAKDYEDLEKLDTSLTFMTCSFFPVL